MTNSQQDPDSEIIDLAERRRSRKAQTTWTRMFGGGKEKERAGASRDNSRNQKPSDGSLTIVHYLVFYAVLALIAYMMMRR